MTCKWTTSLCPLFLPSFLFPHFSCFFSFLLLLPFPSPFPCFSTFFLLLSFLSGWSGWRGWHSGIELKPSHSSPCSHGAMAVLSGTRALICGISNGFLFASWFSSFSSPNLKIQTKILKEIVFSRDRVLPPQKKGFSWNTFVAPTSPRYLCSLPCSTF